MRLVSYGALLYDRGVTVAYQFLFLTPDFYIDYANCTEIERNRIDPTSAYWFVQIILILPSQ